MVAVQYLVRFQLPLLVDLLQDGVKFVVEMFWWHGVKHLADVFIAWNFLHLKHCFCIRPFMKNNYTFVIPTSILTFVRTGTGMIIKILDDLNLEMALL